MLKLFLRNINHSNLASKWIMLFLFLWTQFNPRFLTCDICWFLCGPEYFSHFCSSPSFCQHDYMLTRSTVDVCESSQQHVIVKLIPLTYVVGFSKGLVIVFHGLFLENIELYMQGDFEHRYGWLEKTNTSRHMRCLFFVCLG